MTLCRRRLTHDHIERDSPGKDKKANWLPVLRADGFMFALCLYPLKKEVTDGARKPGCQARQLIVGKASSSRSSGCTDSAQNCRHP